MVRLVSRFAAAVAVILWASSAPAMDVASESELRICLEQVAEQGPVECFISETVVKRTSGSGAIGAVYSVTLPTSRRIDAVVRFASPVGCLVWDHSGAEPTGTVDLLRLNAPSGVVAGSRVRFVDLCLEERRDGEIGGSAATTVRDLVLEGPGASAVSSVVDSNSTIRTFNGAIYQGSAATAIEKCSRGEQGEGFDATDGRWESVCLNFNWHGWRDATQANASFDVECTADGDPHAACVFPGETIHVGYGLHRIALGLQFLKPGGRGYLPPGLYADGGAGLMQDGSTRAKFPKPYDPEWEARSDFAALGYPTELRAIVMNQGRRIVGAGWDLQTRSAGDPSVSTNRPIRRGTFILDDRGNAADTPGASGPTLDGETGTIAPMGQYRMHVGYNRVTSYCSTTSNTDPRCITNLSGPSQEMPGVSPWGIDFPTLANIASTNMNICVPDTDWTGLGTGQTDAKGTCSLNRQIRCWDQTGAADVARSAGGCDFGAGGDFGVCQAPFEALQADYTTAGQDLQIALHLTECPDNASSSADCATPLGNDIWISDLRAAPGGSIAGASCDSGNGTIVQLGNARPVTNDFSSALTFPTFYVGGSGAVNRIFPVVRGSMDLKGAGFENLARMPANWLTRDSATAAADCLSGGNVSTADDEEACDTDTLSGFALGFNGKIGPGNLFAYASQALANKSAVVETFPGGGPNYFVGNTIDTHFRQTVVDWGTGYLRGNVFRNLFAFGANAGGGSTVGGVIACFSGDCRVVENRFESFSITYGVLANRAVFNVLVRDNEWTNVGHGDALYLARGAKNFTVDGDTFSGLFSNVIGKVEPGEFGKQQPAVTFRNLRGTVQIAGVASGTTTGAGHPNAMFVVEAWDSVDAGADDFKSILIDDVDLRNSLGASSCLLWIEDDWDNLPGTTGSEDVAALTRESANRIIVSRSGITGSGSPAVLCAGQYDYQATAFNATNSRNLAFERFLPRLIANRVNNVPQPDSIGSIAAAEAGDADNLPHGTVVRIHDAPDATCAHTSGALTGSGSTTVSCKSNPGTSGSATDGTWAPL